MQISYTSPEGQLKHIDANINPRELEAFLTSYAAPQSTRYKSIKIHGAEHLKSVPKFVVYASAPTHHVIEKKSTHGTVQVDVHYPKLYKGCKSLARFIMQMGKYFQNKYFQKSKYVTCFTLSECDSYQLYNLDLIDVTKLYSLVRFKDISEITIAFVPKAMFKEMQRSFKNADPHCVRTYYGRYKYPFLNADVCKGKYLNEAEVDALAQFNQVDRAEIDFGVLPAQRCFKARYANGDHGLVLVGGMENKPLSAIKKLCPTRDTHKLKGFEEINIVDFAKYQTGADFIHSLA